MKKPKSPEMLITGIGLIFVGVMIIFTLFYKPVTYKNQVIYKGNNVARDIVNIEQDTKSPQNSKEYKDKKANNIENKSTKSTTKSNEGSKKSTSKSSNVVVNINNGTKEELMQLKGVGEVTAQRIIDYRETNGAFNSIEDITNVKGIGDATFEKLKNNIVV